MQNTRTIGDTTKRSDAFDSILITIHTHLCPIHHQGHSWKETVTEPTVLTEHFIPDAILTCAHDHANTLAGIAPARRADVSPFCHSPGVQLRGGRQLSRTLRLGLLLPG